MCVTHLLITGEVAITIFLDKPKPRPAFILATNINAAPKTLYGITSIVYSIRHFNTPYAGKHKLPFLSHHRCIHFLYHQSRSRYFLGASKRESPLRMRQKGR